MKCLLELRSYYYQMKKFQNVLPLFFPCKVSLPWCPWVAYKSINLGCLSRLWTLHLNYHMRLIGRNNFLTCVFLYSYRNCNLPKLRHKRKLLHSKLRYLNLKESCSQHNKCPQQGGKDFEALIKRQLTIYPSGKLYYHDTFKSPAQICIELLESFRFPH